MVLKSESKENVIEDLYKFPSSAWSCYSESVHCTQIAKPNFYAVEFCFALSS